MGRERRRGERGQLEGRGKRKKCWKRRRREEEEECGEVPQAEAFEDTEGM